MPPKSLYKAIGFNDMNRVKIMMEGNDDDKRAENSTVVGGGSSVALLKRKSTANMNKSALRKDMDEK